MPHRQSEIIKKLFNAMETLALINSTQDLDRLIVLILSAVREVMGVEASSLAQIDPVTNELYFSQAAGGSERVKEIRLKMGEGIAGHVAETKQPMIVNDVKSSPFHYRRADEKTAFETKNMLCVPLIVRDKAVGILQALNKKGGELFDEDDLKIFEAFGNQVAVALENARLYKLAVYDGLTGIFDRRYFNAWIDQEYSRVKRYNTNLSLIMFDLDHFKNINDTYGHQAGDFILQNLAGLIKSSLRKADLFARYGGEEFIIALPETKVEQAINIAEKCRVLVQETKFDFNGTIIPLTISLGVSNFRETPEHNVDRFIKDVDRALYLAKESGRNQVQVYPKELWQKRLKIAA